MTLYAKNSGLRAPYYFIETKIVPATDGINHPDPKPVVELLVKVLHKHMTADEVIIQFFDTRTLS